MTEGRQHSGGRRSVIGQHNQQPPTAAAGGDQLPQQQWSMDRDDDVDDQIVHVHTQKRQADPEDDEFVQEFDRLMQEQMQASGTTDYYMTIIKCGSDN
jgi:hypothetical protein